jgi:hypothetical protein
MGKKKKKNSDQNTEMEEELQALSSIYDEEFRIDEDRHGFMLRVVPHPGDVDDNWSAVYLHVRWGGLGDPFEGE